MGKARDFKFGISRSSKLRIKYLKNDDRYDVGVNRGLIGIHPWAIDWHDWHDL